MAGVLDWLEGRNIHIEYRFSAGDPVRTKEQVKELVSLAPDVIVGNGTPVMTALRQATTSIPIVFSMLNDPVGQGFVSSMSRPGGNITGFSFIDFSIIGKWVGLLKDVSPNLSRVALMFDPDTSPYWDVYLRSLERLPRPAGVDIKAAPVRNDTEIEQIVARLGQETGSGLIAAPDVFIANHREAVSDRSRRTACPNYLASNNSSAKAALCLTGRIQPISFGGPPRMSIAFCAAKRLRTCQSNPRSGLNLPSI
jgi:putative ABC transport system substrate-binding protein